MRAGWNAHCLIPRPMVPAECGMSLAAAAASSGREHPRLAPGSKADYFCSLRGTIGIARSLHVWSLSVLGRGRRKLSGWWKLQWRVHGLAPSVSSEIGAAAADRAAHVGRVRESSTN